MEGWKIWKHRDGFYAGNAPLPLLHHHPSPSPGGFSWGKSLGLVLWRGWGSPGMLKTSEDLRDLQNKLKLFFLPLIPWRVLNLLEEVFNWNRPH